MTDPGRPWAQFQIQSPKEVQSLIDMAVVTTVGDGSNTYFWEDRWLNGKAVREIAPAVAAMVPKRIVNKRRVNEALHNMQWIADFRGALTSRVLLEYLELFQILDEVVLHQGMPDTHIWRLSASGQYSTNSAYKALFQGATLFDPANRVWKIWAPNKCRIFMWLVEHNRCWTANKLARRGMEHPDHCLLCDQHPETINHLLLSCVFIRQIWFELLQEVGLQQLTPLPSQDSFEDWWHQSSMQDQGQAREGVQFFDDPWGMGCLEAQKSVFVPRGFPECCCSSPGC
jgi:hypothetical protein